MSTKILAHLKKVLVFGILCLVLSSPNSLAYADWEVIFPSYNSESWSLSGVHFTSSSEGWLVGGNGAAWNHRGILLHYYNGTFSSVEPPLVSGEWGLQGTYFTSPQDGWAVGSNWSGDCVLLHYSSGTWTNVSPPSIAGDCMLTGISFVSPDEGWAVGWDPENYPFKGILLHYNNTSWQFVTPPADLNSTQLSWGLSGVHFTSFDDGWAVGDYDGNGLLLHYSNGTWAKVDPPSLGPNGYKYWNLTSVHLTSQNEGWAVGVTYDTSIPVTKGVLLHYYYGSWSPISPLSVSSSWALSSVHFTSPSEGWAVGHDFINKREVLFHYNDGVWENMPPTLAGGEGKYRELSSVHSTSSDEVWAAGIDSNYLGARGIVLRYSSSLVENDISIPTTPGGPSSVVTDKSYTFETGGSSSNLGHSVQYLFDWGDGTNSGWLPFGTFSASKAWESPGIYSIRAKARCATHTSNESGWTDAFSITIIPETISTPAVPWGSASGDTGASYTYFTGGSVSNADHSVQYLFDWGDGTNSGWLPIGTTGASHSWSSPGAYLVKAQARCATHNSITSSWSEALPTVISSVIILQSPSSSTVFDPCALITNYQPTFSWTAAGTFPGFKILFSTSSTDFTTRGIKVAAGSATGTSNSWKPSSFNWKAIMKASNNNGSIRPIYWKVVGTKADKTIIESEVRSFSIGTPQTVNINAPLDIAILDPAILPTFDFDTNCNTKFKLEISSLSDFSVSTKIKAFNFTVSNPNLVPSLQKTLSAFQWTGVKKLVGTGTGYFRIKAWDGLSRPTVSEVKTFTIQ